ncbi:hypothetical protein H0H93_000669 [Arthromyces matolae]|nr:hypothetical protein H0H93_000669 [Arthromyces matolae]
MNPQLCPLEVNAATGEPFLRVPYLDKNIVITPPRLYDVDATVVAFNDPKIYTWISGTPLPYQPEHGLDWLSQQMKEAEDILRHFEGYTAKESLKMTVGCPVRIIREVNEDGTDTFLGYISIHHSERKDVSCDDMRAGILADDALKMAGDPDTVWDIEERHGQGIMTAAMSSLLKSWAIPRLNAHKIQASVLEGNVACMKVLQRHGFHLRGISTYEKVRGVMKEIQWLDWTRQ